MKVALTQTSFFISILILLIGSGCSTTKMIVVGENKNYDVSYENGVPILKSTKKHSVVVRLLTNNYGDDVDQLPAFLVGCLNRGNRVLTFSTGNVSCVSGSDEIAIYTYESLQKRIKREANFEALAVALGQASQAMAASMPKTSYGSGSASVYGTGGYAQANVVGTTTTYDPAATAAAQAQINATSMRQMEQIVSSKNIRIDNLDVLLRKNSIEPGQFVSGVVKLNTKRLRTGNPLNLMVTIDGEVHTFSFITTTDAQTP